MNGERCISCGCVVDKEYHGHHSAADCRIMKFAESHAKDAKIEVLEEVERAVFKVITRNSLEGIGISTKLADMLSELKASK